MTPAEMSLEFDVLYDNISSNAAPGINIYEKSLFLTKAQDDLVRSHYSPYNTFQKGFESSENRRTELRELITPYSVDEYFTRSDEAIDPDSKFFEIPDDVYYIIQEQLKINSSEKPVPCYNGNWIGIKPITHDEYNESKNSPFRKPNFRKAWRLDITNQSPQSVGKGLAPVPMVEIITPFDVSEYKMRYIRKPKAIVVGSFESDPELAGLGLTVEGRNATTSCELNDEFHRLIVDKAVELAIRSYRENSLQANVELNNRNV